MAQREHTSSWFVAQVVAQVNTGAGPMVKRHITARIEESTAAALDQWAAEHGTGRSEAIERLIKAGLEAGAEVHRSDGGSVMDQMPIADEAGPYEAPQEATGGHAAAGADGEALRAVVDVLKAANSDLRAALIDTRATVATLTAQLDVKDRQIEAAHELADQAQRLHAAEVTRALPEAGQHTTLFERIKAAVRGQQ